MKFNLILGIALIFSISFSSAVLIDNENIPLVRKAMADILSELNCSDEEIAKYNITSLSWECATDETGAGGDITAVRTNGDYLTGGSESGDVELLLDESELNNTIDLRTASTTYYPSSISNVSGILDGGNLTSVLVAEDDDTYNVSEEFGADPLEIVMSFLEVESFNSIILRQYYSGTAGHEIEVCLFDWVGGWDCEYGFVTDEGGFTFKQFNVLDPTDHIQGGVVLLQLNHVQNGIPSHDFYLDYAILLDGYSTITGEETDPFFMDWLAEDYVDWENATEDFNTTGNATASNFFGSLNWSWLQNIPTLFDGFFSSLDFTGTTGLSDLVDNDTIYDDENVTKWNEEGNFTEGVMFEGNVTALDHQCFNANCSAWIKYNSSGLWVCGGGGC